MIQGLCAAYQATGTLAYLAAARHAADFIQDRLTLPDGGVYRVWKDGIAKVPGFLEDYAFLSNALLDLYESCLDKRYLDRAEKLVALILDKFWGDGLYFTPRDGEPLVHRPRAQYDNAWPSGLSSSVFAFLRLHALTGRDLYRDRAEHEFQRYRAATVRAPAGFAHLLAAQDFTRQGPLEIIFAGDKPGAAALVECVHRAYLPSRALAFADDVCPAITVSSGSGCPGLSQPNSWATRLTEVSFLRPISRARAMGFVAIRTVVEQMSILFGVLMIPTGRIDRQQKAECREHTSFVP
jgi:uncharacterized protein YyaL (SSP411 family)